MNGMALTADELDAVSKIQSLAAGELTEDDLARWVTENSRAAR